MKRKHLVQIIKEEVANAITEMPYLSGERGQDLRSALAQAVNDLSAQGLNNKEIASVLKSKARRAELAPDFAIALEDQFEKYGGEERYTPDLGGPQTQRAVDQEMGLSEPGKRGRKKKPEDGSTPEAPEPRQAGVRGRPAGGKNIDLTSLIKNRSQEQDDIPIETGSEDEGWYSDDESAFSGGPSDADLEDIEDEFDDLGL